MYSKQDGDRLQKTTAAFLKKPSDIPISDVERLRDVLRFHEYRYYVLDQPLISDFEYDKLYKALERIEKEHPASISADSPTQRVAKGLTKDFPTVQHLVPMLSLDNSYNSEELVDFDRRARELSGVEAIEYCVEPKFDGASISMIYENDFLARGATRGDGVQGDDVTANVRQIRSIPLSAKFSKFNVQQIEVRGEVLINKTNFKKYNDRLIEQGEEPKANPRNMASGTLRIKDPEEVKKRSLEAFVYHISDYTTVTGKKPPAILATHAGSLQMLWELGFRSPQ
ncbi:MAG TPA: DNA ligase (NAD(+)) LigA, partial [Chitinophagaceae bacterium]